MSESKNSIDGWHPVIFFGKKNLNGRIYNKESITDEAIEKMNENIVKNLWFGELGHPATIGNLAMVRFTNISHAVDDIDIQDDIMFAKIRSLGTPSGDKLKAIVAGCGNDSIVFRPRVIGNVNADGIVNIKELISFDAVNAADDSFLDQQEAYNKIKN